jgi:hypothetical protein
MDESEIKKLLRVLPSRAGKRGWRCPDEIQLAAYVAKSLAGSERNSIESHLVGCDFCLGQVAFLTKSADWANSKEVPANLLSGARNLLARERGRTINWGWRWAAATAAVACLALLFVVIALRQRKQDMVPRPSDNLVAQQTAPERIPFPESTPASPTRLESSQPAQTPKAKPPQAPAVRNNTAAELLPKLITPRDGAVLRRSDLEFRWEPVPDAIFYDVRVMSADGDLVFEQKTENTRLKPTANALLLPGAKYFVVARAHLLEGKSAKSSVVSFRIAGP